MFEEHRRIGPVEERVPEQIARLMALAGEDSPSAPARRKQVFRALAVSGAVAAPPSGRSANHQRNPNAREHAGKLDGVVGDLVERERDEIREHDLNDGRHPSMASPMAAPMTPASLMGVESTRSGKAVLKTGGDLESAAVGIVQILAQKNVRGDVARAARSVRFRSPDGGGGCARAEAPRGAPGAAQESDGPR